MLDTKNHTAGRTLLGASAAGFTASFVALLVTWNEGVPASAVIFTAVGMMSGVLGVVMLAVRKGALVGLSAMFLCVGIALIVGVLALKTGWGGDPNIGAGLILMIGILLQPVGALAALVTLVTEWVGSRKAAEVVPS